MEGTWLWDIEGNKGYIYAAFKIRSDRRTTRDRKWSRICIQMYPDAFPLWNAASVGSSFKGLDTAKVFWMVLRMLLCGFNLIAYKV